MTGLRRVTPDAPDDDLLDGCPDGEVDDMTEEETVFFPLFAEALDPDSPVTVEQVAAEWVGIREDGGL